MAKFLDDTGLSYFVSKLKDWFGDIETKLSNRYTKTEVDKLIKDPTANITASCVGYDDDILGGY